MKLHVDKKTKKIVGYTLFGNPTDDNYDFIEIEMNEDEITEDLFFSKFENGKIILDEDYKNESLLADKIKGLRDARETTCFPIVNRGQVWYNALSTEQLVELQIWYQAWLDAPQTLIEPEKPAWIK